MAFCCFPPVPQPPGSRAGTGRRVITAADEPKPRPPEWRDRLAALVPAWISPNQITMVRIGFALCIALVGWSDGSLWWVFVLGFLAGSSDFFDGAVARYRGQTSKLGAFLDPLGDKVLAAVVLFLVWRRDLLGWPAIVAILAMESHAVILPVLIFLDRRRKRLPLKPLPKVRPNQWGKHKTGGLAWSLGFLLLGAAGGWPWLMTVGRTGVWLSVGLGAVAMVKYFLDYRKGLWT
ncbi:MAG: CDP-alcohol phosphatidyltransferase family protein [Deltaproteobacteria bacterium]|nr:CDP-alcohol phosphatidyltransferase family protein [Deltaproteobacteria bacterium]